MFDLFCSWGTRADADANGATATTVYAVSDISGAAADSHAGAAANILTAECYSAAISGPAAEAPAATTAATTATAATTSSESTTATPEPATTGPGTTAAAATTATETGQIGRAHV